MLNPELRACLLDKSLDRTPARERLIAPEANSSGKVFRFLLLVLVAGA